MAERIAQSVAKRVAFEAFLSSDHISPATGKTIAVTISKNGAAFGNPNAGATNATEIGNGSYYVDLDTTDTGTLGPLIVKATEGTIDQVKVHHSVEAPILTTTVALVEPTGVPAATATIPQALAWLLAFARNKLTFDGTNFILTNDAGATIATFTCSDAAGVTTRNEGA